MTKEAMKMLTDLKLYQKELERERERLLHQEKRLDEEIQLLEEAVRQKQNRLTEMKLPPCDCCGKREELTQHYCNYYEMNMMFCKDCLNQKQETEIIILDLKHKIEKHKEAYSMMCAEKTRRYNELMKEKKSLESEIVGMKLDARNGKL